MILKFISTSQIHNSEYMFDKLKKNDYLFLFVVIVLLLFPSHAHIHTCFILYYSIFILFYCSKTTVLMKTNIHKYMSSSLLLEHTSEPWFQHSSSRLQAAQTSVLCRYVRTEEWRQSPWGFTFSRLEITQSPLGSLVDSRYLRVSFRTRGYLVYTRYARVRLAEGIHVTNIPLPTIQA